jgi:Tol biopolymer transport system component
MPIIPIGFIVAPLGQALWTWVMRYSLSPVGSWHTACATCSMGPKYLAWGGSMAVRILLVLGMLAVLYGCGQAGSPAGKQDMRTTGQANGDARNSKPPTDGCLGEYRRFSSVNYSLDGQKIVFTSLYDYNPQDSAPASASGTSADEADDEICVVNADGTGMINLTDDSTDERAAVWSPDGTKIAFVRSPTPDDTDIFVMNADGTDMARLTTDRARLTDGSVIEPQAVWSPDGTKIAFVKSSAPDDTDIFVMNADGSNPKNLTTSPDDEGSPTWSPDGRQIAFVRVFPAGEGQVYGKTKIFVMDADGGDQAQLLPGRTSRESTPDWSPDGEWIAFLSDGDIYVTQVGDIDQWRQLTDDPVDDLYPTWSPDGTEIAFYRYESQYATELYKVDSDGSNETRLRDSAYPYGLTWSPDGKHVAYLAEGGLYVVNADGSNPTLVVADRSE